MILACNLIFLGFTPIVAGAVPITTFKIQNPTSEPTEVSVQFKYTVHCPGVGLKQTSSGMDEVRGSIVYQGRRTIVDFFRYRDELEVALGSGSQRPEEAVLELDSNPDCVLAKLEGQVAYENVKISGAETSNELWEKLALIYSPFINLRENQYDRTPNDTPLVLTYSIMPGSGNHKILRYTVFLSDEDNQITSADTNAQMARYGRSTDIEWCYDIELDSELKPVRESYQGILHFPYTFRGDYLPGGHVLTHPVLYNYNLDDNNVFVDTADAWIDHISNPKQKNLRVGHHLVPRIRVDSPQSRERVMFANSWMYKVSETELQRQNKPSLPPKDQLFVLIRGKISSGSFLGEVDTHQGEVYLGGGLNCNSWSCNIVEFGTDLWGQEGLTTVPVGAEKLEVIGTPVFSGEFRIRETFLLGLEIKRLRFFRLRDLGQTFGVEELSSKFKCDYRNAETVCRF